MSYIHNLGIPNLDIPIGIPYWYSLGIPKMCDNVYKWLCSIESANYIMRGWIHVHVCTHKYSLEIENVEQRI